MSAHRGAQNPWAMSPSPPTNPSAVPGAPRNAQTPTGPGGGAGIKKESSWRPVAQSSWTPGPPKNPPSGPSNMNRRRSPVAAPPAPAALRSEPGINEPRRNFKTGAANRYDRLESGPGPHGGHGQGQGQGQGREPPRGPGGSSDRHDVGRNDRWGPGPGMPRNVPTAPGGRRERSRDGSRRDDMDRRGGPPPGPGPGHGYGPGRPPMSVEPLRRAWGDRMDAARQPPRGDQGRQPRRSGRESPDYSRGRRDTSEDDRGRPRDRSRSDSRSRRFSPSTSRSPSHSPRRRSPSLPRGPARDDIAPGAPFQPEAKRRRNSLSPSLSPLRSPQRRRRRFSSTPPDSPRVNARRPSPMGRDRDRDVDMDRDNDRDRDRDRLGERDRDRGPPPRRGRPVSASPSPPRRRRGRADSRAPTRSRSRSRSPIPPPRIPRVDSQSGPPHHMDQQPPQQGWGRRALPDQGQLFAHTHGPPPGPGGGRGPPPPSQNQGPGQGQGQNGRAERQTWAARANQWGPPDTADPRDRRLSNDRRPSPTRSPERRFTNLSPRNANRGMRTDLDDRHPGYGHGRARPETQALPYDELEAQPVPQYPPTPTPLAPLATPVASQLAQNEPRIHIQGQNQYQPPAQVHGQDQSQAQIRAQTQAQDQAPIYAQGQDQAPHYASAQALAPDQAQPQGQSFAFQALPPITSQTPTLTPTPGMNGHIPIPPPISNGIHGIGIKIDLSKAPRGPSAREAIKHRNLFDGSREPSPDIMPSAPAPAPAAAPTVPPPTAPRQSYQPRTNGSTRRHSPPPQPKLDSPAPPASLPPSAPHSAFNTPPIPAKALPLGPTPSLPHAHSQTGAPPSTVDLSSIAPYIRAAFNQWFAQDTQPALPDFLVHYFGRPPNDAEVGQVEALLRQKREGDVTLPPPRGPSGQIHPQLDRFQAPIFSLGQSHIATSSVSTPAAETTPAQNSSAPSPAPVPVPSAPRTELPPGEVYERLACVGEGTYGKVYKARNVETDGYVALKRIRMEGEKEGFPVTAMREIKLLQGLRHRNVIRLVEMMVSKVFMVFEYMELDLTGLLAHPEITFTPANIKSLTYQMLDGLAYLHDHSILHRDLKGSNILLGSNGILKLADFGLARFYNKRARDDYTNRVITLWYRSPELLLGETVYQGEVDMWSAGCIMLELFTTKPIFQGADEISQLEVIFSILGTPDAHDWPTVEDLPWYELVRPKTSLPNKFRETFSRWLDTPLGMQLVEGLLMMDPTKRLTAREAMKMGYFWEEEPGMEIPDLRGKGEWHEMDAKASRRKKEGR